MTIEKLDQLEDRIQKPGYLLLIVVILLFLIIGLVNLLDEFSNEPVIFGRYSVKYFALIVAYALLVLAWASLLLRPNNDRWLTKSLDYVQKRPLLALIVLAAIAGALLIMFVAGTPVHQRALFYPALQATVLVISLLAAGLILFYKWGDESRPQLWRKIVVGLLLLLLAVELIAQALAYFGLLPSVTTTAEGFTPYARIYYTEEGFGNGLANSQGRYTDEFELLPEAKLVALIGGSHVQALQVDIDQDLGVVLEEIIRDNAQAGSETEVLTLGYPDRGPGIYLSEWMLRVVLEEFAPEETIAFFNLGHDFQTVTEPGQGSPYFVLKENGEIERQDELSYWIDKHQYEHGLYYGHEGLQLIRLIPSHLLSQRVLGNFLTSAESNSSPAVVNSDIDLPNGFVFHEDTNDKAMAIAQEQIRLGNEQLLEAGTVFKLVTIPAFTDEFYAQDSWNTQFGESDLLLPEQELRAFAAENDIPFFGLGAYMASLGMSPNEVQALYFADGRGSFTPQGHEFAAQAAYDCFFAGTLTADAGCDRR